MTDSNNPDVSGVTDDDLAQLSAEERALMEEMRKEGAAEDGEGEGNEPAGEVEGGEDDPSAATGAVEGEPAAAEPEAADPAPAAATPAQLTPLNANEEIASLNAERQEALAKMMDGDLDPKDYAKLDAESLAKILEINQKQAADLTMHQFTVQQMQADFDRKQAAVLADLKGLGLNTSDPAVLSQFSKTVAMFSREAADDGVNDSPGNLENAEFALREAAALMQVRHKLLPKPSTPAPKQAPRRNELDRSTIPPSLANVPAAAVPQVSGEFDHLSAAMAAGDYTTVERAVARMTPEQQQRWADQ